MPPDRAGARVGIHGHEHHPGFHREWGSAIPGLGGSDHRGPFYRVLIAHAQADGMTTLTRDKWIPSREAEVTPL